MTNPASSEPAPAKRAALGFIFVTVVIDIVAMGITIPVLPRLVEQFEGGNTAHAASIYGAFGTVFALMQFIFAPVLGVVSDRYGRRPVILLSCLGLGLDYILMAVAPTVGWLFLGRTLSGITAASFATASAYIADVTPPEKRAASFGVIGAAFGLGFVLGPALGGLLGGVNPRLPFWVSAGLALTSALYGFFVLPESLAPERRKKVAWSRANPMGSLRLLRSHHELFGLATTTGLYFLGQQVLPSVYVLYTGYRYGWSATYVGLTLALVGVCNIVVQGLLVKRIVARFGERRSMITGLAFQALGFTIFGVAPSSVLCIAGIPVLAFMGLYNPSAQGLMTRRVAPHEQGQLQGANASILGLAGIVGPPLFTLTFAAAIGRFQGLHMPGAPFLLAAALVLCGVAVGLRATRTVDVVAAR